MMRDPRHRSPESSRRRRAGRRDSRQALADAAAAAAAAAALSSQPQGRARADSSSSSSSSTSSSLLNISRKSRFGIRNFFASSKVKKVKKRRSFRRKNSSSSSVDSDLAYGAGYISRSSFERQQAAIEQQLHHQQQHQPSHQQYPHHPPSAHPSQQQASQEDPLFGPDGRPALHRAQTDEEIIALGRKLSDLARAENQRDLERAGKKRPSRVVAAAAAISQLHLQHSHGHTSRGIGSSKPHSGSDESDSDWESASDSDSDSDSSTDDSGLAYGPMPKFSDPELPLPAPSQYEQSVAPTTISQQRPLQTRRKSSAVDPALFGPVNSLRGFVNTPCGFQPGEYPPPPRGSQTLDHQHALPHDPIPQPSSASIEARPLRNVYPVPTAEPSRYDAAAAIAAGVSVPLAAAAAAAVAATPSTPTRRDRDRDGEKVAYTSHPRPDSVEIQAPKPWAPRSPRVLVDEERAAAAADRAQQETYQGSPRERRSRKTGRGEQVSAVEAVASGALPALVGAAVGATLVGAMEGRREPKREGRGDEGTEDHVYDLPPDRRHLEDRRFGVNFPGDGRSAAGTGHGGPPLTAAISDRPERRRDARDERGYDQSYDRHVGLRDGRRDLEDHSSRPAPDNKSIAEIAASAGIASAVVAAAGAAILSDSGKQRELDELRETEARIREERLDYERQAQRDREARERLERQDQRLRDKEEEEKERRRQEEQDEYERLARHQREIRYKDERRAQIEQVRAERDRIAREAETKRDRHDKREREARDDDKERSLDSVERRRSKGKDVVVVVDDRPRSKDPEPRSAAKDSLQPGKSKPSREERRAKREETRRMIEALQREIELEKERLAALEAAKVSAAEERPDPGPSSSKEVMVDPFQFQVANDAFETPQFRTPMRSRTPVIQTVEPPWASEEPEPVEEREPLRPTRRDIFEQEQRDAHAIVDEANRSTMPGELGVIERQRSPSRSRGPRRDRDHEPVRDPVQEEANRYYREQKLAEKIYEERSRSASPTPSVVDKYEDTDGTPFRIVTPPEMKRPPKKTQFDGPNADVRIDNIIMPHDLPKFLAPPIGASGPGTVVMMPVFKSRDPSCERERPMLNIVLPTPSTSPSLEKMKAKQAAAIAAADETLSEGDKKTEERKPKVIINARGQAVEVPDDYNTGRAVETDSGDSSQERRALNILKFGRKKSAWGSLIAAAVQSIEQKAAQKEGTAVVEAGDKPKEPGAVSERKPESAPEPEPASVPQPKPESEPEPTSQPEHQQPGPEAAPKSVDEPARDAVPDLAQVPRVHEPVAVLESQLEPARSVSPAESTPPRRSRVPFDFDDEPPSVGPKPSSPGSTQTPGTFGEDLDFTATLAAGLQSSGFNPNIVIQDPTYRKRDSPPGSSEPIYVPPSCETVTDLDFEPSPKAIVEEGPDAPVLETTVSGGPVYDDKAAPKSEVVEVVTVEPSLVDANDEWATESSKKSKKKPKRRKSTKDAYDMRDQAEPPDRPGDSESFQWIDREVSSVVSDPIGKPNGSHSDEHHDAKSVVSLPSNGTSEHHERSITQNGGEKDSFLDNAGTFGAGAGLAGAVAAIAAQIARPNATQDSAEDQPLGHLQRSTSCISQTIDPEVIQREIKPAIDPQYGDLLPLPPSDPGSPFLDLEEAFPSLPESEEDLPAATRSRRGTVVHTHARRRSAIETPKTPSRTAVPVQFLIGRAGAGSAPSSPAFRFSSPTHSPVAVALPDTSPHRTRSSRPTSWDSTREIKPLYLLEKTSYSGSAHHSAAAVEPQEYPALPPSEPPSRESPGPEFEGREGGVDYLGITRGAGSELQQVMSINTGLANKGEVRFGEPLGSLGSGETTPRAVIVGGSPALGSFTSERGEGIGVGRDEEQERAAESFSPVPMDVVRLRHLPEGLETLPPLLESILASPVLPTVATAAVQLPAEEDLEKLPALPESPPGSPLLMALPLAATRRPTNDELEELPALPESELASPVQDALHDTSTRPSMPGGWVTETLSTPGQMSGEVGEREGIPSETDNAAQLPLPESRPDSPVEALPASASESPTRPTLAPGPVSLTPDVKLDQLPPLPDGGPGSPAQEVHSSVAESQPLIDPILADGLGVEGPASERAADFHRDLEELPPLPESTAESPALGALPAARTRALAEELSQLPPLPESPPLSPGQEEIVPAVALESLPAPVPVDEHVERASPDQDEYFTPEVENVERAPLDQEQYFTPGVDTLPHIGSISRPTPESEQTGQAAPFLVEEPTNTPDLETVPPLPESRPVSPVPKVLDPPVDVGSVSTPTTEVARSVDAGFILPPSPEVEQTGQAAPPPEEEPALDSETLPPLPESRPSSPCLEALTSAVEPLVPQPAPAEQAEQPPHAQEHVSGLDLDTLPPLPESRSASPTQKEAVPIKAAEPLVASVKSSADNTEGTAPSAQRFLQVELGELPPLPDSRPSSPVQAELIPAEAVEFSPVLKPPADLIAEQGVHAAAEERGLEEDLGELPPLPASRPSSPVRAQPAPAEVVESLPALELPAEQIAGQEDLEKLPPLPDSRPGSLIEVPVASAEVVEPLTASPLSEATVERAPPPAADRDLDEDLDKLPALPDSRPDSPTEPSMAPADPAELQPVVELTASLQIQGKGLEDQDLSSLPPLPESRPSSPTQLPGPQSTAPGLSTSAVSELREAVSSRPFPPTFSQESTVQARDFAEQCPTEPQSNQAYQPAFTYTELTSAAPHKHMPSPPLSDTHGKHGDWETAGKRKSTLLLLPSAAAAGAGAASSLTVAQMRYDESQPDVEPLEDEKMRNLSYDADESVCSFNEDASTIAASEAPTYLSGSTLYETQYDRGKLEDSPAPPGTLSFFLGNLGKRGQKSQVREDVWSPLGVSSSSKRGKGEPGQSWEHEGSTQPEPRPVVEVQAMETQETSAGQVEQRTPAPIDLVEDIINPPKLERSASARKKSKKKAGKKGVSWSEPWPEHQQQGDQIDDASAQNPGPSSGIQQNVLADDQQQTTPPLHEAPTGKETGEPSREVEKQGTLAEPTAERGLGSRPASASAAGAGSDELEQLTRRRRESESAPAEPAKTKKGIFGSSFSMLPSIFASPGSLLGIGKRQSGHADQQDAEKETKQEDQAQVGSSRAEFPVSSERHEQQHTGEPLHLPNPPLQPPATGLHDKDTTKAEPAPQESAQDTTPEPVSPAVGEAGQQDSLPEPQTNAEPTPASEEPSSTANQDADGDEAAEPAGKKKKGEGKEEEQGAAVIEETPAVVESGAPETVPEPAAPENPQRTTGTAEVEAAAVEMPADDALAEPAPPGKKSKKKKKKKQASQDTSSPAEVVTEQSIPEVSEEPRAAAPEPMTTTDLPQQDSSAAGQDRDDVPPEPSSPGASHVSLDTPTQPVNEPSPSQGDTSPQADEAQELVAKGKKSKKKKKKGGLQQALEAETAVQPSNLETRTQTEAVEVPQEAESVAPETPAEQQASAPDVPQQLEPSSQETQQDQQQPESEMSSPTRDFPPEPEPVAPDTQTLLQPEMSGETATGSGHEIDSSSSSEAAKRGVSATDERPSSPGDEAAQQEAVSPIQEANDPLTDSPNEERKKKRHSVAFAEPLVEFLEPANATGEEDNDCCQNTRDSKDSEPEVPTVPLQSGGSVDAQPAQSEPQSHPSAQVVGEVGVTAPSLSDAAWGEAGSGSDKNSSSQQENIELEDSRSLDQPADSKGHSQTGLSGETADESAVKLDSPDPSGEAKGDNPYLDSDAAAPPETPDGTTEPVTSGTDSAQSEPMIPAVAADQHQQPEPVVTRKPDNEPTHHFASPQDKKGKTIHSNLDAQSPGEQYSQPSTQQAGIDDGQSSTRQEDIRQPAEGEIPAQPHHQGTADEAAVSEEPSSESDTETQADFASQDMQGQSEEERSPYSLLNKSKRRRKKPKAEVEPWPVETPSPVLPRAAPPEVPSFEMRAVDRMVIQLSTVEEETEPPTEAPTDYAESDGRSLVSADEARTPRHHRSTTLSEGSVISSLADSEVDAESSDGRAYSLKRAGLRKAGVKKAKKDKQEQKKKRKDTVSDESWPSSEGSGAEDHAESKVVDEPAPASETEATDKSQAADDEVETLPDVGPADDVPVDKEVLQEEVPDKDVQPVPGTAGQPTTPEAPDQGVVQPVSEQAEQTPPNNISQGLNEEPETVHQPEPAQEPEPVQAPKTIQEPETPQPLQELEMQAKPDAAQEHDTSQPSGEREVQAEPEVVQEPRVEAEVEKAAPAPVDESTPVSVEEVAPALDEESTAVEETSPVEEHVLAETVPAEHAAQVDESAAVDDKATAEENPVFSQPEDEVSVQEQDKTAESSDIGANRETVDVQTPVVEDPSLSAPAEVQEPAQETSEPLPETGQEVPRPEVSATAEPALVDEPPQIVDESTPAGVQPSGVPKEPGSPVPDPVPDVPSAPVPDVPGSPVPKKPSDPVPEKPSDPVPEKPSEPISDDPARAPKPEKATVQPVAAVQEPEVAAAAIVEETSPIPDTEQQEVQAEDNSDPTRVVVPNPAEEAVTALDEPAPSTEHVTAREAVPTVTAEGSSTPVPVPVPEDMAPAAEAPQDEAQVENDGATPAKKSKKRKKKGKKTASEPESVSEVATPVGEEPGPVPDVSAAPEEPISEPPRSIEETATEQSLSAALVEGSCAAPETVAEPQPDDNVDLPAKKKKGKKGKKASVSESTSGAATPAVDVQASQAEPETEVKEVPSRESSINNASAGDPARDAPETVLQTEDVSDQPSKKPKKKKKKKGYKASDPEAASGTLGPVEEPLEVQETVPVVVGEEEPANIQDAIVESKEEPEADSSQTWQVPAMTVPLSDSSLAAEPPMRVVHDAPEPSEPKEASLGALESAQPGAPAEDTDSTKDEKKNEKENKDEDKVTEPEPSETPKLPDAETTHLDSTLDAEGDRGLAAPGVWEDAPPTEVLESVNETSHAVQPQALPEAVAAVAAEVGDTQDAPKKHKETAAAVEEKSLPELETVLEAPLSESPPETKLPLVVSTEQDAREHTGAQEPATVPLQERVLSVPKPVQEPGIEVADALQQPEPQHISREESKNLSAAPMTPEDGFIVEPVTEAAAEPATTPGSEVAPPPEQFAAEQPIEPKAPHADTVGKEHVSIPLESSQELTREGRSAQPQELYGASEAQQQPKESAHAPTENDKQAALEETPVPGVVQFEAPSVPEPVQDEDPTGRGLLEASADVQTPGDVPAVESPLEDALKEESIIEFTGKKSIKDKRKMRKTNDSLPVPQEEKPAAAEPVSFDMTEAGGYSDEAPANSDDQPKGLSAATEAIKNNELEIRPSSRPQLPVAEKVELHPTVSEAFQMSPQITAPARTTIGLGLIPNPPDPYPEGAPSPQLLTALETPPSLDTQVEASRQLGVDLTPAQPSSRISHDPPFDDYEEAHRKKVRTQEQMEPIKVANPVVTARGVAGSLSEDRYEPTIREDKEQDKGSNWGDDDAALADAASALSGGVALLAGMFGGVVKKEEKGSKQKKLDGKSGEVLDVPQDKGETNNRGVVEEISGDVDVPQKNDVQTHMAVEETTGSGSQPTKMELGGQGEKVVPERSVDVEETNNGRGHVVELAKEVDEEQKGEEPMDEPAMMEVDGTAANAAERKTDVGEAALEKEAITETYNVSEGSGLGRMDSETIPRSLRDPSTTAELLGRNKKQRQESTPSPEPVQRAFSFPDDIADEEVFTTREPSAVDKKGTELAAEDEPVRLPPLSNFSDFMRSYSSLPPVQEELSDKEDEPADLQESLTRGRRHVRHVPNAPELHRDSGISSSPPRLSHRLSHNENDHGAIRDSGVHLKDSMENIRTFTPVGESLSQKIPATPRNDDADRRVTRRKSPLSGHRVQLGAIGPETPRLHEPSPPARTPEPEKLQVSKKRGPASAAGAVAVPLPSNIFGAAGAVGAAGAAAAASSVAGRRSLSENAQQSPRPTDPTARRVPSNTGMARLRTPEPALRPDSRGSLRSYGETPTPPLQLRRMDRRGKGDLRAVSLSQRDLVSKACEQENLRSVTPQSPANTGESAAAIVAGATAALGGAVLLSSPSPSSAAAAATSTTSGRAPHNTTPIANEGRARAKQDMTDVYDGFGEGRIGSPRSPTRPHSMRRRQSMQMLELQRHVEELMAENRRLAEARAQAESSVNHRSVAALAERDAEIESLKRMLKEANEVIDRLNQTNEGLRSSTSAIAVKHHEEVRRLEADHAQTARTLQDRDNEIVQLRTQLEATTAQIREMQQQILERDRPLDDPDFLDIHDIDYFDHRCQQLCAHVQQWVLRFSKFSDMRACRLTSELSDEKLIDRLDNAVLDGSNVDSYLSDRVRRRDIFMSMTMNMIWEFVFTRYLFGMDREQRQKLKQLEKQLIEVGPPHAVRQWRAVTLTLLSRRPSFKKQRDQDTEAVVQAIFDTLSKILPPPSNLEEQIQSQLRRVIREAVGLAIEMRCQRAEYMMLPPLQPEYDDAGELTELVTFNAALMNEASGSFTESNEELEVAKATVRVVLFPLVLRKGDDQGRGDDEIVVTPAQVLVVGSENARGSRRGTPTGSKGKNTRLMTPVSEPGGVSLEARSVGGSSAGGDNSPRGYTRGAPVSDISMEGTGDYL